MNFTLVSVIINSTSLYAARNLAIKKGINKIMAKKK